VSRLGSPVGIYEPDSDLPIIKFFDTPSLLASAVYDAFYKHFPLRLNPNIVWLTIVQGFATYVNENAEALRDKFVSHKGKQTITIQRGDFRYGSPANDWASVFPQFADAIEARTKAGIRELLESNFSNTTATDRACSHIALMDVCQSYFAYRMCSGCGIPRIDLLGTVEDWRLLRTKAEALKQFVPQGEGHLSVWLGALLPALDHFVAAAEGSPDVAFWGSVCNLCGASGIIGSPVTGWVSVLFPYLLDGGGGLRPNPKLSQWARCFENAKKNGLEGAMNDARAAHGSCPWRDGSSDHIEIGVDLRNFPPGLSSAPVFVQWSDVDMGQNLTFYGGIFALHQHPDGALEPRTGWAVVDCGPPKTTSDKREPPFSRRKRPS
jgi:hypothetical protein